MMVDRVARRWNPTKYLKFEGTRLRPALDLLAQVKNEDAEIVVDVGCGTGNMGPFLKQRWPRAKLICVDSSEDMLDKAREYHREQGLDDVEYTLADFESLDLKDKPDVIFSNAALHWVSFEMHKTLMPKLMQMLKNNGTLAFQIPDTRKQNSHLLMGEAATQMGMSDDQVKSIRWVTTEQNPEEYLKLLAPYCRSSGDDVDINLNLWATEYSHILYGENPVADFTSSTGLGPYLNAFGGPDSTEGAAFSAKYRELIANAYPKLPTGETIFELRRFFCVAQKGAQA